MSRNPRSILDDLVAFARQFRMHEESLVDPVDSLNEFDINGPVFLIEQGFSGAAYGFFRAFEEYKARMAELPCNPFSPPLRRAIDALPELIESRFRRWGWDLSFLTPDGFAHLCERCKADQEARERAVEEAAVSWRTLGKNLATHHGADRVAFAAETRGVKPTMTPKEGERAYHQRVKELWMNPMIGETVPEVTLEEHDRLCSAVTELDRLARREWLPAIVIQGNPFSKSAEAIPLTDLERAEGQQTLEQPRDEARPSLSKDQQWLLVAALQLSAIDSDSRKTANELATEAKGRFADSANVKKALSNLVRAKLLESQQGRGGGYWLTQAGKGRAERLK